MYSYPSSFWRWLATLLWLAASGCAHAVDHAILDRAASANDFRAEYAKELLLEVLEHTVPQYGPYVFTQSATHMERGRLLWALKQGRFANVTNVPADTRYLHELLAVDIPIDMGMQNWRIALVDARRADQVAGAVLAGRLQDLAAGVGTGWVSERIFADNGYRYVSGGNYDGLFEMLQAGRFEYFPRGVHEIFQEFDVRRGKFPSLEVDRSFLMHVNLPTLFFVSPTEPRLQQRIQAGMEAMLKDGSLERFVLKHFRAALLKAKLCRRYRIELVNKDLLSAFHVRRDALLDPFDPRLGICSRH